MVLLSVWSPLSVLGPHAVLLMYSAYYAFLGYHGGAMWGPCTTKKIHVRASNKQHAKCKALVRASGVWLLS